MKELTIRYKNFFTARESFLSCMLGFLLLLISLIVNCLASQYAFIKQGSPVPDIILDNIPVVNVENVFIIGTWLFIIFLIILVFGNPQKVSFVLKTVALFVIIRSFFISLTHIGPSPFNTLIADHDITRALSSGADLFFSGHTGMPFLFALIYWFDKRLRYFFITASILSAAGVLLGHIHYSIDVASAYFITYGIFIISEKIFKKDYQQFKLNS